MRLFARAALEEVVVLMGQGRQCLCWVIWHQ